MAAPVTQSWWDELERLARILGQIGPDEVCCEGLTQRQCAILRTLVAQEGACPIWPRVPGSRRVR
jgi:hypothetical protein